MSLPNSICFWFNLVLVFPKVTRLQPRRSRRHLFIFSNKRNIGLPDSTSWAQEVLILSSHFVWATHFSSNRCKRFQRTICGLELSRFSWMGSWSEYATLRCSTLALGKVPTMHYSHKLCPTSPPQTPAPASHFSTWISPHCSPSQLARNGEVCF